MVGNANSGRKPKGVMSKTQSALSHRPAVEPLTNPRDLLKIPDEASEKGKWLYQQIADAGAADKILAQIDSAALMIYCEMWSRWWLSCQKSEPLVIKSKSGNPTVNPYVWIMNALAKTLVKLASELGLTPVGRARMAIEIQKAETDWDTYVKAKRDKIYNITHNIKMKEKDDDDED